MRFLNYLWEETRFLFKNPGLMILLFLGMPTFGLWFGGAYFQDYVEEIPIAVLDEDGSALSRRIVQYLAESEYFSVQAYPTTQEKLEETLSLGEAFAGIYLPPDLEKNVLGRQSSQVLLLTNGTNVVIANNAYAGAAQILQTVSAGIEIQMVGAIGGLPSQTAQDMALSFQFSDRILYDSKMTYMNYLMYGFLAVFFQQFLLSGIATLFFRNPEETARQDTFLRLLAKILLPTGILTVVGAITIGGLHSHMHLAASGNPWLALCLAISFALAVSAAGILLSILTKSKNRFSQVAYMLSVPTFLTCGYVWPLDQMPQFLQYAVRVVWPLAHFARPFDEIMVKGLHGVPVLQNTVFLLCYAVVMWPVAYRFLQKSYRTDCSVTMPQEGRVPIE